ncbi:type II secretion system ATPase GspE [Methylocucumis oryzae]|uniref:Type II secretion system protein E n=1 Tax=Methylocucumis oryzae TaxID=1632867 RepID=A0A0F3ILN5_9GAMM|nr:type II secretion system ATPase GspE [Methylocucumis oryzae]KJV06474.1 general secretion pathway protein GspE [Methylocucumis oryzae]
MDKIPNKQEFYQTLSERLLSQGRLTQVELVRVQRLMEQIDMGVLPALLMMEQAGGDGLPELLIRLGLCSDKDVAQAIAHITGLELIYKQNYPIEPPLGDAVSVRFFREHKLLVVDNQIEKLVIAVVDPAKEFAIDALRIVFDKQIEVKIGNLSDINEEIEKQFGSGKSSMDKILADLRTDTLVDDDIEHLKDMASEAPVIRIVNLIMQKALDYRASDIHIEPFEQKLIVRLRVDGVLRDLEAPPVTSTAAVISRIKIMAKLNISERRLPQDGRIKLQIQGKELDMRVSTLPTMYGESVVIRLLDKESVIFDFDKLGFIGPALNQFIEVLTQPHGIILITGPTGSGKTTSLYTALNRLNTGHSKIITVEDPVEYQLVGINQVQVQSKIGLDFPAALRSIVRQDPDIIMIGEMRDKETAAIAIQSALTGHLVLSTLHTNDAIGSVTRLLDMGIEDYLLTSTLNAVLAQRLVRRLCPHCRHAYNASDALIEQLQLRRFQAYGDIVLYTATGCAECSNIGYKGRAMVVELFIMTDSMRTAILKGVDTVQLKQHALEQGMTMLYDDGIQKALAGMTSLEEIARVTAEM